LLAIEKGDIPTLTVLLQKSPSYVNINVYLEKPSHPTIGYFTTPLLYALELSKFEIAIVCRD
jgi:hypothetical protein